MDHAVGRDGAKGVPAMRLAERGVRVSSIAKGMRSGSESTFVRLTTRDKACRVQRKGRSEEIEKVSDGESAVAAAGGMGQSGARGEGTYRTSTSPPWCMMNDPSFCFIESRKRYIPFLSDISSAPLLDHNESERNGNGRTDRWRPSLLAPYIPTPTQQHSSALND